MKRTVITGIVALALAFTGTTAAPIMGASAATPCPGGSIGSTTVDGVTVTFSGAKRDNGGQNSSLKPGYTFQDVHVALRNRGKYHYSYNSLDFALLDAGAHDYAESGAFNDNLAQRIDTGTLSPGQTISGDISFAVPAKVTPAAIRWIPTGLGLNDKNHPEITDYVVRLPGYKGSAAPCPAGPLGVQTAFGVTVKVSTLKADSATSDVLKPGYSFRVVHVTMTNHGKYHYAYNPNDFTLVDTGATLYGQATAFDDKLAQPIDMGTLGPGGTVSGELAFALPTKLAIVAIRWQPTGLGLNDPGAHLDVGDYIIRLP